MHTFGSYPTSDPVFRSFAKIWPHLSRDQLMARIAIILTTARARYFITQEQFAKMLSKTPRMYQKWEAGDNLMGHSIQSEVRRIIHQISAHIKCKISELPHLKEKYSGVMRFFDDVYAAIYYGHYDMALERIQSLEEMKSFYSMFPVGHDIWIRTHYLKAVALDCMTKAYNESHELECIKILDQCIAMQPEDQGLYAAIHVERAYYDFMLAKEMKKAGHHEWRRIADKLVDNCLIVEERSPNLAESLWNRANVASLLESRSLCLETWIDILNHPHTEFEKIAGSPINERKKVGRIMNCKDLHFFADITDLTYKDIC